MAAPDFVEIGATRYRLSNALSGLTAEQVAYFAVALCAGVLRFVALGRAPLNPGEAGQALAVWQQWHPGNVAVATGSPAYFTITALISQVLGFSDAVMRLAPAVVGFALTLTPWFIRHRVGRVGALLAALLLAVSPLQTLTARTANGQSIALLAGMMFFIAWLRYQETGRSSWLYALAVALATGLASAPLFFAILVTLVVAWLAQRLVGPPLIRDEEGQRATIRRPSAPQLRQAAIVGLAAFLLLATLVFFALPGIGSAADMPASWIARFQITSSQYLLTGPFVELLRYEVALVLVGLLAAVWAATREKPFAIFLVYWVLAALLLLLLQPGTMANVLLLTLPGYLLVGSFVDHLFRRSCSWWWWALGAAVIFAGAVFYLNLVRFARLSDVQGVPDPRYHLLIAVLALLVIVALAVLLFGWDGRATSRGLVSGVLALLLVFTWGSAWWLSRSGANDTRERWTEAGTDSEVRLIRQTAEELSWQASNSASGVSLLSVVDAPQLRWYLRDFDKAAFVKTLPSSTASEVLITPLDYDPAVDASYIGAEYNYAHPDTVHTLGSIDALRWWLFHQSPIPVSSQTLILWLRSDIAEGNP
jgi:hypothetical protein